jgi:predicted DNA-binding transcriptional regulator AlpA
MNSTIRVPVKSLLGNAALSRGTIYLRIAEGTPPTPVPLGGRSFPRLQAEIKQRIEYSRGAQ